MTEANILKALQTAVLDSIASSTIPNILVQPVGRRIKIPNLNNWLELVWIPNNLEGEFWGDEKIHRGVLRLFFHWSDLNSGAYKPVEFLESISSQITKGSLYFHEGTKVKINETPNIPSSPFKGEAEDIYYMSIRYVSFSNLS